MLGCGAVGLYGFIKFTTRKPMEVDDYMGVHTANPAAENPFGLFCIIVTCVTAFVASVVLACARGCGEWAWLVSCQASGIAGQALLYSFNRGYAFYGSIFWEQVTIFSLVIADGILNEEHYLHHFHQQQRQSTGIEDKLIQNRAVHV